MAGSRTLAWNAGLALVGNLSLNLGRWGFVIVTAHLLGSERLGELALGLAIATPAFVFAGFRLRDVQAADATERFSFSEYLHLRFILSVVAVLICSLVGLFGNGLDVATVIACTALYKAADSLGDVAHGVFQKGENMSMVAWSLMGRGAASLLLFPLVLWLSLDLRLALLAVSAASLAFFLLVDLRLVRRFQQKEIAAGPVLAGGNIWRLFLYGLPLGIAGFVAALIINIPRYLVSGRLGAAELGVFAALGYQIVVGNQLVRSVGQSAVAGLGRAARTGDRAAFLRLLWSASAPVLGIGVLMVLGAWLGGPWFLRVVYGAEYARQAHVLVVLMAAGALFYLYGLGTFALIATGRVASQVPVALVAAGVTAMVGWYAISQHGIIGAAWSAVAGYAVACCGTAWTLLSPSERTAKPVARG